MYSYDLISLCFVQLLTPMKSCVKRQLRNRPVLVPGSTPSAPLRPLNLDDSISENEHELLTEQGVPSELSEDSERVQGLVEEMDKMSVSSSAAE